MARLSLSKSELQRQERGLATYRRFLPSLDLKRRQLMAERAKAEEAIRSTRASLEALRRHVAERLPMAANEGVDLEGLVAVAGVDLGEENIVGARVPVLRDVRFTEAPYSPLAKPHWVDRLVGLLREALALRIRAQVEARRLALLNVAVRKVTQRVNLFDKVLIPRAQANIRRIKVHLADTERAGVVRAKIAKRKRAEAEVAGGIDMGEAP